MTSSKGVSAVMTGLSGLVGAIPLIISAVFVDFTEAPHLLETHIVGTHESFGVSSENTVERSDEVKVLESSPNF